MGIIEIIKGWLKRVLPMPARSLKGELENLRKENHAELEAALSRIQEEQKAVDGYIGQIFQKIQKLSKDQIDHYTELHQSHSEAVLTESEHYKELLQNFRVCNKQGQELQKGYEAFKKDNQHLHQYLEEIIKANQEISNIIKDLSGQYREGIQIIEKSVNAKEENISALKQDIKRLSFRIEEANKESSYLYYKGLHSDNYRVALCDWYFQRTGKHLDLDNPKTFNEKIQWLKLYDSTPIKTRLADKYLVRDWVAEKIGDQYLIPLLGVWDRFEDIAFDTLPLQFVLKANHGSAWNIIVPDKTKLNLNEAKNKFNNWLKHNFAFAAGLELHYMNIPPKIVAEEYIADLDGDIYDYRFFCFNGKPEYVWVDIGSGTSHHRRNIYDLNWNLQNYQVSYPNIIPNPKKPSTFEEMILLATKLCQDFSMVRIDFYSVNERIYFGEMTFTSQSGLGKWSDENANLHYGDLIHLPKKSPCPKYKV